MRKNRIAAVIDIGSSMVRMHISQWNGQKVVSLDRLEKPTQIGKEVFSTGYVSFDTVRALSDTLGSYKEKAREYGISTAQTIASTAMREASNQAYILDRLYINNKLEVDVLEDSEVGALIIGAMKNERVPEAKKILFVYGGTGTIDFELSSGDIIEAAYSIQTGILKISDMLREAEMFSGRVDLMAEEYVDSILTRESRTRDFMKTGAIVFGSADMLPLYKLCGINSRTDIPGISGNTIKSAYESIRRLSVEQISRRLSIGETESESLRAMTILLAALLKLTKAKELQLVQISLADAALSRILRPGETKRLTDNLFDGALASARELSERYKSDTRHCGQTAAMALEIFEKLKKDFGFSKKQRLFLHIACILHEVGFYTTSFNTSAAAFNLVSTAQIYGLLSKETLLIANIIAPHSLPGAMSGAREYSGVLSDDGALLAAKMHALLLIADTLDFSHKQKLNRISIELAERSLVISVKTEQDFTLEQWAFRENAGLFQEVFGITPVLKINNRFAPEGAGE